MKAKGFRLKVAQLRKKELPELRDLLVAVRAKVAEDYIIMHPSGSREAITPKNEPVCGRYQQNRKNVGRLLQVIAEKAAKPK